MVACSFRRLLQLLVWIAILIVTQPSGLAQDSSDASWWNPLS